MDYSTINYEIEDSVALITLSRPDNLNAFTIEMSHELIHAFQKGSEDDDLGAIIVTGSGRAFCAGMDLDPNLENVFGYILLRLSYLLMFLLIFYHYFFRF